jgi:hypothetical protein
MANTPASDFRSDAARGLLINRGGDAPNDGSNSDEVRAA